MNIILCGLPKVGKTTVGKIVADRLGWKFIDTDKMIEKLHFSENNIPSTCREIFRLKGEQAFRQLENRVIISLIVCNNCVISLGGGALLHSDNIKILQALGPLIYLEKEMSTLLERINKDIPVYIDQQNPMESFIKMAKERSTFYKSVVDHIISADHPQIIIDILTKGKKNHGK